MPEQIINVIEALQQRLTEILDDQKNIEAQIAGLAAQIEMTESNRYEMKDHLVQLNHQYQRNISEYNTSYNQMCAQWKAHKMINA